MRQMSKIGIGIGGVLLLCLFAFLPATYERTIRDGTDEFNSHHALWGKRVKTVSDVAVSPIRDIGLILVNLKRVSSLASVMVQVKNEAGEVVADKTVSLPPSIDDEFTWFSFDSTIVQAGERYTVEVSAPEASSDAPVGVRFDATTKELALAIHERIPVWEKVVRWTQEHEKRFTVAWHMAVWGASLAALCLLLEYMHRKNALFGMACAFLFLVGVTLYIRIPVSNAIDSAYGGDAFNYLLKGNAWPQGADPFSADPRKAPLYSFLTVPGLFPSLDPILWARGISIVASMATVILACLFLMQMGVPLAIALGGGLLLSVNRDYQFESVQGLSNSLYAALIMAAAYLFLVGRRYAVSVVAGLATLTRYEGGAAAVVLLGSFLLPPYRKISSYVRDFFPFLFLSAIPLVLTPITGAVGVRTASDIAGDEGLYVAYSWEYLLPSIKAFKLFFGRLWILAPGVGDVFLAFGYGVLIGIVGVWFFKRYGHPRKMLVIFPLSICLALLFGALWGDGSEIKVFIALLSGLTGLGAAAGMYMNPKRYLPVLLMVLLQTAVITAILPKNRYYLQIIPFIAIAIAGGIWVISGAKEASKASRIVAVLALSLVIAFVYGNVGESLSGQISDYNEKSAEQTVMVEAGRYVKRNIDGVVASSADSGDIQLRVYVEEDRLFMLPSSLDTPALQYEKLKAIDAVVIVETSWNPYFQDLMSQMPEKFEQVQVITTRHSSDTATIYRVY